MSETVSAPANQDLNKFKNELNKATRKFNIMSSQRMACFYGNAMQETMWFSKLHENNSSAWYFPWDGRGFLQLTHPGNYFKYWRFLGLKISPLLKSDLEAAQESRNTRGLQDLNNPQLTEDITTWRDDVANDDKRHKQSDSAGSYWAWTEAAKFADRDSPYNLLNKVTAIGIVTYYSNESFGQVASTVNFGRPCSDAASIDKVNGIVARYQAFTAAIMVFGDSPVFRDKTGLIKFLPVGFQPRRS